MHLSDVLFIPRLKKNLLGISALEEKGFRASFVDGKVLMWLKNSNMNSASVLGVREGGLYRLK